MKTTIKTNQRIDVMLEPGTEEVILIIKNGYSGQVLSAGLLPEQARELATALFKQAVMVEGITA